MKSLPENFKFLLDENAPKVLVEALRHYGEIEFAGKANNPTIKAWAKEIGVDKFYISDDIPWCGLFIGLCLQRSGYKIPVNLKSLGAIHYSEWGTEVEKGKEKLSDILVFSRKGGNHVGLYVGESISTFWVLGGNQSDSVSIVEIEKIRLVAARRCPWVIGQPINVRKIHINSKGMLIEKSF